MSTDARSEYAPKDNPDIEKCVFVVDRKDLDRQTREEFNRFQEGCVEENTHTGALVRRLLSEMQMARAFSPLFFSAHLPRPLAWGNAPGTVVPNPRRAESPSHAAAIQRPPFSLPCPNPCPIC